MAASAAAAQRDGRDQRRVKVHDVEPTPRHDAAQTQHPPEVLGPGDAERMDGHSSRVEALDEGGLPVQDVRDLEPDTARVMVGGSEYQQALRASEPESLRDPEDPLHRHAARGISISVAWPCTDAIVSTIASMMSTSR